MAKKLKKITDEEFFDEAWRRGLESGSDIAALDLRSVEMAAHGKRFERKDFKDRAVFNIVFEMLEFDAANEDHVRTANLMKAVVTDDEFLSLRAVLEEQVDAVLQAALDKIEETEREVIQESINLSDFEIRWLRKLSRTKFEDTTMDDEKVKATEKFKNLGLIDDRPDRITDFGRQLLEIYADKVDK